MIFGQSGFDNIDAGLGNDIVFGDLGKANQAKAGRRHGHRRHATTLTDSRAVPGQKYPSATTFSITPKEPQSASPVVDQTTVKTTAVGD